MAPLFYDVVHKETFTNQLLALPPNAIPQIIKKIELLRTAPAPDAKSKKRLVGFTHPTYRLRSGDYRIVYTFSEPEGWVALLGVDGRSDVYKTNNADTFKERVGAQVPSKTLHLEEREEQSGLGLPAWTGQQHAHHAPSHGEDVVLSVQPAAQPVVNLPRSVTGTLLERLRVPAQFHPELIVCKTLDDLTMAAVPENVRERVFDALVEPDFDVVAAKPSLVAQELSDFQRFYDGELTSFLLRLDAEQQRFVNWAVNGSGPALVKGGPGSGKTVIALYRVRALIDALRERGNQRPRILLTAYTNTLVTASRQMLRELIGADADHVEIFTADKLAWDISKRANALPAEIVDDGQAMVVVKRALDRLARGSDEDRVLAKSIQSLNLPYLLDEIDTVLVARQHSSLESYLAESRTGRGKRLTAIQRQAIWRVHDACEAEASQSNKLTWAQFRRRAAELVLQGTEPAPYDGVLIDEAQDLQPTTLRLLVALCKSKDRLFLTADPNQSIYGSGFRWADVHQDLQFRGRTGVLRTNYRSTQQIMSGAGAYLRGAELDESYEGSDSPRKGHRPAVRFYETNDEQMHALSTFIRKATYSMHRGLTGCAVLTPSHNAGMEIARWLTDHGQPARFMARTAIDLDAPVIKVVPMKSAKGLEFPIVALAGLSPKYPGPYPYDATDDQIQEIQLRERRTLYVGMTRAMEALLVLAPRNGSTLTEEAFDSAFWEIEQGPDRGASDLPGYIPPPPSAGFQIPQAGSRR